MFSPSKDKIDILYASHKEYFNIEDDGELNKYLGVELYCLPDVSIHLGQPYLIQIIPNIIPGMDKSRYNPTPVVKACPAKKWGIPSKKNSLITDQ